MFLKDKIKKVFIERLPNTLLIEHVELQFPKINKSHIKGALDELVSEGFLEIRNYSVNPYNRIAYKVKIDTTNLPISLLTDLGDFKIPRMLDGDVARGEDINAIASGLVQVFDYKIEKMKKYLDKEIKRYWASVASIFGIFISIFSIVNFSIKPLYFSENINLSPHQQFVQTLYNVGPLAGVLFLFLIIFWLILR